MQTFEPNPTELNSDGLRHVHFKNCHGIFEYKYLEVYKKEKKNYFDHICIKY